MELVAGRPFKRCKSLIWFYSRTLDQVPYVLSGPSVKSGNFWYYFKCIQICILSNVYFFASGLFGKWPSLGHAVRIRTSQDLWSTIDFKDQVAGGCPLQEMTQGQIMDLLHIFGSVSFLSYLEVWTKHSVLVFLERNFSPFSLFKFWKKALGT